MTLDDFLTLKRGDVIEWVDGLMGVVRAACDGTIRVVWENGSTMKYTDLDADWFRRRK